LIKKLIDQIIKKLDNKKRRFLLLEADTSQHDAIIEYAEKRGMKNISRDGFIIGFSY
jgi:ABC-type xylose transport system substrate-binding protein